MKALNAESLKDELRRMRWRLRSLFGRESFHSPTLRTPTRLIGGIPGQGGWVINPVGLSPSSVVYAVGVGDNISFDLDLIDTFGVTVHALDPTPASHAWLASQSLPAEFVLHKVGLANFDGTASFAPNDNPEWVSHSMVRVEGRELETLPVCRLSTIMAELGHDRVNLLKLDIEGAEYGVIDDLLKSGVAVDQLLVEFHHRFDEVGWERTNDAIAALRGAGYEIFYVNGRGEEFGFVGAGIG
jgi:FkbM family methyltransferase